MGGLFSKPKTPALPPPPPPPPAPEDPSVQAAARAERERQARLRGGASTVLTSGLADEPTTATRKLLGDD